MSRSSAAATYSRGSAPKSVWKTLYCLLPEEDSAFEHQVPLFRSKGELLHLFVVELVILQRIAIHRAELIIQLR